MKRSARRSIGLLLSLVAGSLAATAAAQESFPERTDDGLERVASERMDAVYWRPGASLGQYERILLLDCSVAFIKDWELNQEERRKLYKADAEDMQRIRDLLAQEFREVFTQELEQVGGYEIVDAAADDVLLLRPAIVNLDVGAPVLDEPGMIVNYVSSTGEMTLSLELYDSMTNSLIGRAIDRQQGREVKGFLISDRGTNEAEADRILQAWASTLREALDAQWAGGAER